VLRLVSAFLRAGVIEQQGSFAATPTGTPQGGIISPLLANIYLSVLDRHFAAVWDEQMSPPWRRQYRRRRGRANYRRKHREGRCRAHLSVQGFLGGSEAQDQAVDGVGHDLAVAF